jgi:hypothetical protein
MDCRYSGDEFLGVRMLRTRKQAGTRLFLNEQAILHDGDSIRERPDHGEVVGYEDESGSTLG